MKAITIIIVMMLLLLSSCVTQKACDRKFPPQSIITDTIHDSIFTQIIKHDTTFSIVVGKTDTIVAHDTTWVFNGLVNSNRIKVYGEYADAEAQVVNSRLNLSLQEKTKELLVTLKDANIEKTVYKALYEKYFKESTKVTIQKVKVGKFYVWFFWIVISLGLGALIWKYKGLFLKLI